MTSTGTHIEIHFGVLHAKCGDSVAAALLTPEPDKVTCAKCLKMITRRLRKAD